MLSSAKGGLKRARDAAGRCIPGLWVGDIVRMEFDQGGWQCQVPVREIGKTGYYEYRPLELGGRWGTIGWRGTRNAGVWAAEQLRAGSHVLKPAHHTAIGLIPARLWEWASVSAEIAQHASVTG